MIKKKNQDKNLKEEILEVSKHMFYELGYDATTFQKIADELNITKGAITYHFKNKHLIVAHIFDLFFEGVRSFIDSYPENYINFYWRCCTMYIYAYRQIMSDPKIRGLFYHHDQMDQWQSGKVDIVYQLYREIHEDFGKSYTHEDLLMLTYIDMGARRRMYNEYRDNPSFITIDRYCYYHVYLISCLCRLDNKTTEESIRLAFDFADRHDHGIHII